MKTDQQFAEDIAAGNGWEVELWAELRKYLHGLEKPLPAETMNGKVIGGFGYQPDMQLKSMVLANKRDAQFYGDCQVSLEAKVRLGSGFDFTCATDFPYDDIIVNEVYKTHPITMTEAQYLKLSLMEQKVFMRPFHSYWIGATNRRHVAVICPATKPLWTQRSVFSPKDRRVALNWMCPVKKPTGGPCILFGKFPEDVPRLLTYL
jgi:hypothetical protein